MKTNVMLIIPEMSMGGAQRSLAKLSHGAGQTCQHLFCCFYQSRNIVLFHIRHIIVLGSVSRKRLGQQSIRALETREEG